MYVARLDKRTRQSDVEKEFGRFGKIKTVTMKIHYAFVDYEDHESALAALEMNNQTFVNGETLVVEQSSMYFISAMLD